MNVIEVNNLKKYFGQTKAVDGIAFNVEKGEVFGFLGPNGAGKTTTIRCLMDFLRPTSGEIKVLGLDSKIEAEQLKKNIGYLSSEVRLYDNWTGQDHFNFSQRIKGKSEILDDLIVKFNFNPNFKFHHLSTGNKRKLGIILALMHEPELVVLDEPTAGLDPILQNTAYEILEDFKKKGITIFMSSHNLSEVDRICDRVAIIKEGKLVTTEGVQEIKNKKIHVVTVHFVKKPVKNEILLENIQLQEELPDGFILDVKGDVNHLINKLSRFEVKDIEISHATLEEVFLEYYNHGSKQ